MPVDYDTAFGLRDNPFGPIYPIAGLKNPAAGNQLEANPLLLHAEPALAEFSVFGYQGTGKTTLVQAMISWLKNFKPPGGEWFVHDTWSMEKHKDCAKQLALADSEQELIKGEGVGYPYCCIVADNVLPGALERMFRMYDELAKSRCVFLFLVTSEKEIFAKLGEGNERGIIPFRMHPLAAQPALQFVRKRISYFRVAPDQRPAWMNDASLFPFDEADISAAFAWGTVTTRKDGDAIALRDFSRMINQMLADKLEEIAGANDAFNIALASEAERKKTAISISEQYKDMVT